MASRPSNNGLLFLSLNVYLIDLIQRLTFGEKDKSIKMCVKCCSDKWTCCCGCHVTKGAHIIAWIYVAFGILGLPFAIIYLSRSLLYSTDSIFSVLSCFTGIPIIVGQMRGKRTYQMYLPMLIFLGIGIVYSIFIGIIGSVGLIQAKHHIALMATLPPFKMNETNHRICNSETDFICLNGQCIHKVWQCNGKNDCDDGSDERLCTSINSLNLTNAQKELVLNRTQNEFNETQRATKTVEILIAYYVLVFILGMVLNIWLYSIVLRAYLFVKKYENNFDVGDGNRKTEDIAL
uniref:Uncharacterized protein n=1 Tax=Globodera rostochiensis TaxID=31243 RepID=A0A914IFK3_GLORO